MPPFQNTPATQAFGFGLGRGLSTPYVPSAEPYWNRSPVRQQWDMEQAAYQQNLMAQQEAAEEALAKQEEAARERSIRQTENEFLKKAQENPELLSNPFKTMPGLAFSKNFGNINQIAENQAKQSSLTPSLRAKLPVDQRAHFDQLVSSGHSPVDAYDAAEHQGKWQAQHGELVGAGVPMNRLQAGKLYSPMEMADLKNQAALNKDKMAEKERILGHQIENWRNHIGDLSKMLDTAPDEELPIIRKQIQDAQSKYQAALAKHDALVEGVFSGKPAGIEAQNLEAGVGMPNKNGLIQYRPKQTIPSQRFEGDMPVIKGRPETSFVPEPENTSHVSPKIDEISNPQQLESIAKDENLSIKDRQFAVDKLKKVIQSGSIPSGKKTTAGQSLENKKTAERALKEAQKSVDLTPLKESYSQSWQDEKNHLIQDIDDFAKTSKRFSPEEIFNALAADEKYILNNGHVASARDLFNDFLKKEGRPQLDKFAPRLKPFGQSKYAKELGLNNILSTVGIGGANVPTRNDVLNQIIKDKNQLNQVPQTVIPPQNKIPIVSSQKEVDALPSGSIFIGPDGQKHVKP